MSGGQNNIFGLIESTVDRPQVNCVYVWPRIDVDHVRVMVAHGIQARVRAKLCQNHVGHKHGLCSRIATDSAVVKSCFRKVLKFISVVDAGFKRQSVYYSHHLCPPGALALGFESSLQAALRARLAYAHPCVEKGASSYTPCTQLDTSKGRSKPQKKRSNKATYPLNMV